MNTSRCLKICCLATVIIILILIVTLVVLYFTIFKPKQPKIVATPVNLQSIDFVILPVLKLDVTIGMEIHIKNPNYAGFSYDNSTTLVYYRGSLIADAPVGAGTIGALSTDKLNTSVTILFDNFVTNSFFLTDVFSGHLNLTSSSKVEGKVLLLGIFKLHAETFVSCDITVFLRTMNSTFSCDSKIKI
ncbi:uncharacterized protein LOC120277242 [Dioscorea cayenensis subsp. rotundata]|uniref:Uncharacterized protein LOC120277242 n=1 Tax=Dioscorea cayennensis subsp. rotundata TaxID=55577 RepID=A0AB40CP42_DIOCR|nr:uncharacterized protein LOC120277242 [Dioscorea cayenensis subsp. rotundata]